MSRAIDWSELAPEVKSTVSLLGKILGSNPVLAGVSTKKAHKEALALYDSIVGVMPDEEDDTPLTGDMAALGWLEDLLGNAIADYEEKHYPVEEVPAAVLVTLMYEHDLTQSDIPEIGSQGVVSEVLSGKRDLNVRQIRDLSERFGVPVACFI